MNEKKIKYTHKYTEYLMFVFSILSLALFMLVSIYNWRSLDDFVFLKELRENSVLSFAWKWYYNWDARFLMPYCLIWFSAMKYLGSKILIPLASISFILCSYNIVRIVSILSNEKLNRVNTWILAAIVNILLWFCLYNIDSQILYWMTGSIYLHAMMLALFWLKWYISKPFAKPFKRQLFYFFSFIVATSVQNVSVGLLVLILIDRITTNYKHDSASLKWSNTTLLAIFIIGIFISTVSPGSLVQFNKMHAVNYDASIGSNSLYDYLVHFVGLYFNAVKTNGILLVISAMIIAIALIMMGGYKINRFVLDLSYFNETFNYKKILDKYKWLIVSICTLAIYWPTLLYGDRYYIGFYYYFFICIVMFFLKSIQTSERALRKSRVFILTIIILTFGIFKYNGVRDERELVARHMAQREDKLSNNNGASSITLEAIDFSTFTRPSRSVEIAEDIDFYANKNYGSYYNIDTVRVSRIINKLELRTLHK